MTSAANSGNILMELGLEAILSQFANSSTYYQRLTAIFGNQYDTSKAETLRQQWQEGDFSNLPAMEVIDGEILGNARGAYAIGNNTIYLSDRFLNTAPQETIQAVVLEEIGHYLDAQINSQDTPGDEGELFSKVLRGVNLTPSEFNRILAEDDTAFISLNGQSLAVEKAEPTVLTVTTTLDESDGSATVGTGLSLRDAILIANNNPTIDYEIRLTGGTTYELRASGFQEDNSLKGDLDIKTRTGLLFIGATGNQKAIIDASNFSIGDRVFDVREGGILGLSNLLITGGNSFGDGGGIRVNINSFLFVANSEISNNSTIASGGGIANFGRTILTDRTRVNNNALGIGNIADFGGGLVNDGELTIINSTVANNTGEGIYNRENLLLINTTVSGNTEEGLDNSNAAAGLVNTTISGNNRGGIGNFDSSLTISNSTITNNNTSNSAISAGGIHNRTGGIVFLRNTIVAGNRNTAGNPIDLSGHFNGNNNNLIGVLTGANGTIGTGSDIVNPNPGLTPLQNNGGFDLTHALLASSPALNAGNNARVVFDDEDLDNDGNRLEPIPFDGRGTGFSRIVGGTVDIGAVEVRGLGIPTLSIEDVTIAEGNSGTTNAILTVRLNVASDDIVRVDYSTENGTAIAGSDFTTTSGTLTFAPGVTSQTIAIPIVGNILNEPDETFRLRLSNAIGAVITDDSATVTITNDDPILRLSVADITVNEGNSGTSNAVLTVTLSPATTEPITVNYATENGTALAGSDYTTTSGTLTFAPGVTSQTIAVPILGDNLYENNETFAVTLSNPNNGVIINNSATVTITNDEPTLSIDDLTIIEGNSGTRNAIFTVSLSGTSSTPVTVGYTTANGTAIAGSDYTSTSGTLTIAPGQLTGSIAIPIIGDLIYEETLASGRNETFFVNLTNPSSNVLLIDSAGTGTIIDTDRPNITRVSVDSDGNQSSRFSVSDSPAISGDGRFVAFASRATNLVPDDTNSASDIFLHNRHTGQTTRVSVTSDGTQAVNQNSLSATSFFPTISSDGRFVAFVSGATNLVPGDTNSADDIFVHDRNTPQTTRISVGLNGTQANRDSASPAISGDGRFVAFVSEANNLVSGDTNGRDDIFVHDRNAPTPQTTRISVGLNGTQANEDSASPAISGDGRFVAFASSATNLIASDTNNRNDIFVHDRNAPTPQTTRISVGLNGTQANGDSAAPSISADGRYVVFASSATNLVAGINGGIFLHDRETGQTRNVVVGLGGAQGNGPSSNPRISGDGRYVVFQSDASNLVTGDTNGRTDIFRFDRQTEQTIRISVANDGTQANQLSSSPTISSDGRYVGFASDATNLILVDSNQAADVFVYDTLAATEFIPVVTLAVSPVSVAEDGATNLIYTFTRDGSPTNPLTVNYNIGGTATNGTDYANIPTSVTFAAGSSTATVIINPTTDTNIEPDETVSLTLSSGTAYTVGTPTPVTAKILNDDDPATLSINNLTVVEGRNTNAVLTVSLNNPSSQAITVNYTTTPVTATADSDYTSKTGTLTIAANATTGTISIPILNDNLNEDNETFTVTLSNPVNATIGNTTGTVTITDTLQSAVTTTLPTNVENLQLTGSSPINGTGNNGNNRITGNSGNNILNGGLGIDTLIGGLGNDIYVVDTTTDTITELAAQGTDTIQSSVTYSIATRTNIENLTLTGTGNINGTGNNENNSITGNSGNNILAGGLGNDSLNGGLGNDTLAGNAGNDTLTGAEGIDRIEFRSTRAFVASDFGVDTITDFAINQDKIVLSKTTFAALTSVVGNGFSQASNFAVVANNNLVAASSAFIVYSRGTGRLFYNQNGSAAGLGTGSNFAILTGNPVLTANDFVLVA